MGLAHTGLSHKQAKHVFTYDHFNNPNPDFPKVESFTGFKPLFSSATSNYTYSGVGFLVRNNYAKFIHKVDSLPGRVIYIDLYIKRKNKLRIVQLYVPPYLGDDNKKK